MLFLHLILQLTSLLWIKVDFKMYKKQKKIITNYNNAKSNKQLFFYIAHNIFV